MTANKLTDEQVRETIAALSIVPTSKVNGISFGDIATALAELQERRKAERDSEPVGEVSEQRNGLVMDGTVDLGGSSTHRIIKGASKMKRLPLGTKFYTAPPAPVVPKEWAIADAVKFCKETGRQDAGAAMDAWNACRAAMLQAGNSPVIPDGYVMVPKEPTEAMMLHKSGCQHHAWDDPDCAMRQTRRLIWSHMLTAALSEVES